MTNLQMLDHGGHVHLSWERDELTELKLLIRAAQSSVDERLDLRVIDAILTGHVATDPVPARALRVVREP
jgi:hypothetical protein